MKLSMKKWIGLVIVLLFILTAACALAKDFDNAAYYHVEWAKVNIPETKMYYSPVAGTWEGHYTHDDDSDQSQATLHLNGAFYSYNMKDKALVWYGWVDETGHWHGHITGTPTVTNAITGKQVTVTRWEADLIQRGRASRGYYFDLGEWSVSGTGSVIEKDTIPSGIPQMRGAVRNMTTASLNRLLSVRLYLSDGNSIKLTYHSESGGMDKADAVTALGGRSTHNFDYTFDQYHLDEYPYIGSINCSIIYLNEPLKKEEYHFFLEKTVTGAPKGKSFVFPVEISINGGKPMTVEIRADGNGTFTKEFTFTGYEGNYTVTATEKASDMPANITIVKGSGSAAAGLASTAKSAENTVQLSNRYAVVPKTGDSAAPFLWVIAIVLSSAVLLTVRRRHQ